MTHVTNDQVVAALDAALEKRGPNWVDQFASTSDIARNPDEVCAYSDADGNPLCIAGEVIAALAPETFTKIAAYEKENRWDLTEEERRVSVNISPGAVEEIVGEYGELEDVFTDEQITVLSQAQYDQDRGKPWGEVVSRASNVLP